MISLVWQKWNQSPVILSFDNKLMTMASIPFPAVTGKEFYLKVKLNNSTCVCVQYAQKLKQILIS